MLAVLKATCPRDPSFPCTAAVRCILAAMQCFSRDRASRCPLHSHKMNCCRSKMKTGLATASGHVDPVWLPWADSPRRTPLLNQTVSTRVDRLTDIDIQNVSWLSLFSCRIADNINTFKIVLLWLWCNILSHYVPPTTISDWQHVTIKQPINTE